MGIAEKNELMSLMRSTLDAILGGVQCSLLRNLIKKVALKSMIGNGVTGNSLTY